MARVHALTRLGTYRPSHPTRAAVAGGVLEAVVARPVCVGVAEVERRAGKDDLAAAGAPHLPAGDEGSEPFPQRPMRATVTACRRASTAAGALELLDLAARTRRSSKDDLPVPADPSERAHVDAASQSRFGSRRTGARVTVRIVSAVKKLGHGHSLMILASIGLLWRRTSPAS
jgi:hypothetical protein